MERLRGRFGVSRLATLLCDGSLSFPSSLSTMAYFSKICDLHEYQRGVYLQGWVGLPSPNLYISLTAPSMSNFEKYVLE